VTRPTVEEIRQWSKVDFDSLGYADDADLQLVIDRAGDYIEWMSGRTMDDALDPKYDRVMAQVVQYKTEDMAHIDQPENVETVGDFMLISSFSAGSYSETRRGLEELAKAKLIDGDPRISSLLWGLMTDDKRDFWEDWMASVNAPAFEVTEVDWSMTHLGSYAPYSSGVSTGYVASDAYGIWPN
jgi:hypothetical protein